MGDKTPASVENLFDIETNRIAAGDRTGQAGEKPRDSQSHDVADRQAPGEQEPAGPAWQGVPL